ncbi:MAG TPA: iron ABC transporter ATP-binding protein [Ruminococcus sp.]|nr:iron ABC transporter ATP-binding protein [Ruminococcus sp.]
MAERAAVTAENITVGYGSYAVAEGITFHVSPGEVMTLIGANGAGKSTVLRSISGQLPLLAGRVLIGGTDIAQIKGRDLAKRLSMVMTERISAERMTCRDVAAMGRYPYTGRLGILSAEDNRAVDEAMELAGVSYIRDRDIRAVSDGQRQCVMLARAIAQEPEVLLLDEPATFLDVDHKLELLTLLRRFAMDKGIAVIQSLHELDLAQRFSDRVLCIRDGKADCCGDPEDVFTGRYISSLYDMKNGSFNSAYGSAEPFGVQGKPEVFVIGGGEGAISVYRRLWRQGVPFAAGIVYENDIACPAAKALAAQLVTAKPFEPVSEDTKVTAFELMGACGKAVSGGGDLSPSDRELLEEAIRTGKLST